MNSTNIDKIIAGIENLCIKAVETIQLKLVFKHTTVGNSIKSCYYYSKLDDSGVLEHILLCAFHETKTKNGSLITLQQ